jgi:predicted dehydrogenase/threonine dehydrogenase-like Zn-dependent dehydrogenase
MSLVSMAKRKVVLVFRFGTIMKQVLQSARTGAVSVYEVPAPSVQRGRVLVRTAASLISAGTEKTAVDAGKKSLPARAKERPDLVKQVIDRVKTEGIANTYAAVKAKLDGTTALGYSAAGIVAAIGDGVTGFSIGDRVACAGAGYASHAEMLSVPQNLCVRLPGSITFDEGAFGTLGAIALQGMRLSQPTLGESFVVIGLGLLGQITVQLLKANGCRVFGVDIDAARLDLARQLGAEDSSLPAEARAKVKEWSRGRAADGVLITAATASNEPVELAGDISRPKGRVIAVGAVGMDIPRGPYFSKELSFQISMSYGPGRYDPEYEERGHDYPFGYVRWTEGRNLEAFFDLVANGTVDVKSLISHRFAIDDGENAYKLISGETKEPYLGIVLQYDTERPIDTKVDLARPVEKSARVRVGLIGAGDYARGMLLPKFKANGVEFRSIATAAGLTAKNVGKQFGFASAVSSANDVLADDSANLIVIATRHDTHASLAKAALERGKHVFVEKPLSMNDGELDEVMTAARSSSGRLMVGFNRRFSPHAEAAKEFFEGRNYPLSILYRVSGGRIPKGHWIQDAAQGGGRIVGEACHFVDLMHFLTGSRTVRVFAQAIASRDAEVTDADSVFITLKFADGSNGTIAYLAEGDSAVPKERIEIFGGRRTFIIDDFRAASAYRDGKETTTTLKAQDKGQTEEVRLVCSTVLSGGDAPIAPDELEATTHVTFRILDSLRSGQVVDI